jgi:hypothetical protein
MFALGMVNASHFSPFKNMVEHAPLFSGVLSLQEQPAIFNGEGQDAIALCSPGFDVT